MLEFDMKLTLVLTFFNRENTFPSYMYTNSFKHMVNLQTVGKRKTQNSAWNLKYEKEKK